ncbi:MAG TPA: response regulator [Candidatus Binataceae bacterium]|nr:response regulator [Candidatus Binataceae bacterium]
MASKEDVILIVDDEDSTRSLLIGILELEGFNAIGFSNGVDALQYMAQSDPPCLIVLDLRMPLMDGWELRSALLKDQRLAKVPVVVVTAFDPTAGASLSAVRVFRKPVDLEALLGVVRSNC